jgi:hypothetical protein
VPHGKGIKDAEGREFLDFMNDVLAREGIIEIIRAVIVARVRKALGGENKEGVSEVGGKMSV